MKDKGKYYCDNCNEVLTEKEIEYNKDTDYDLCFPCMKGNRGN